MVIRLELPVYWNVTKKQKRLIGMNWYQRADKFQINKVKQKYQELVELKLLDSKKKIKGSYQVKYTYFYKDRRSDLGNVTSVIDKFFNDALQKLGIVENDNVEFFRRSVDEVGGLDKENPRMEIEVEEIK